MPMTELDGLPIIETDESEEITVAVKPEDIEEGDDSARATPHRYSSWTATRRG